MRIVTCGKLCGKRPSGSVLSTDAAVLQTSVLNHFTTSPARIRLPEAHGSCPVLDEPAGHRPELERRGDGSETHAA
jgi:hypothetical protein